MIALLPVLLVAACGLSSPVEPAPSPVQKGERWPRPDERIECGPLTIEVYVSRTAHRFHVVDQISEWDDACHGQYLRHMELDDLDRAMLERHREIRVGKRWGQGLEQTFYTPLELDQALAAGRKAGRITADEAETLEAVLEHFAERADALMEDKRRILTAAFARLDRARFTEAANKIARFTGVKKITVPAFPIASPEGGGGGMDGGRLRWELADENLSFSVLLHELTHAFFMERNDVLRETVERTPGFNMTLIGEGFAYAVAPGMYPDGDGDTLAHNVAQDRCGNDRWDGEMGYGMQRMFGLAVRPILQEAFESGAGLEQTLPRVRDAFLVMNEVMMAEEMRPPMLYIGGGPVRDFVREHMGSSKYHLAMNRFNLSHGEGFADARLKGRHGDLLVILISGEDSERVPRQGIDLLPVELDEVMSSLRAKKTVEAEHQVRQLRVVLLAAPTDARLQELVRDTKLLEP